MEDRYVNFILGVSSYVAVSGKPVPFSAFRPPTSKAHLSLVKHSSEISSKGVVALTLTKCWVRGARAACGLTRSNARAPRAS